jgi:hypothetical protein
MHGRAFQYNIDHTGVNQDCGGSERKKKGKK